MTKHHLTPVYLFTSWMRKQEKRVVFCFIAVVMWRQGLLTPGDLVLIQRQIQAGGFLVY